MPQGGNWGLAGTGQLKRKKGKKKRQNAAARWYLIHASSLCNVKRGEPFFSLSRSLPAQAIQLQAVAVLITYCTARRASSTSFKMDVPSAPAPAPPPHVSPKGMWVSKLIMRILSAIFSIVIIGLAASNTADWYSSGSYYGWGVYSTPILVMAPPVSPPCFHLHVDD